MYSCFEQEDNSLENLMNTDEEFLLKPSGEGKSLSRDYEETSINNSSFIGNNNIFTQNINNYNDVEEGNFNFQHNNYINERNDNSNLMNSLDEFVPNENSDNNTRINDKIIEKSNFKENPSIIISQSNDQTNNAVNKPYRKKIFLIIKEARKESDLFKIRKKRGKRKPKNGIESEPRSFNINLKFKGIIIDSIFNFVNEKSRRFKFKKLKYEIKRKDYKELKSMKVKSILENVSKKQGKDLEYNKKIIAKIYEENDYELIKILELHLSDVFYHILCKKKVKETDILKGLKKQYKSLIKTKILTKAQKYIQAFKKVSYKYIKRFKKMKIFILFYLLMKLQR